MVMLHGLSGKDRLVLVMYFDSLDLRAIGRNLRISEDAAQKRLSRALAKLRELLSRKGLALSVLILTKSLENWTDAANLLPGKAVLTVSAAKMSGQALQHARLAWFYKLLPHGVAAGLGAALVGGLAAGPIASRRMPVAHTTLAHNVPAVVVSQKAVFAVPPSVPTFEDNLDVNEIVRRVVVMAKMQETELIPERGEKLLLSIKAEDALTALRLLTAQLEDTHFQRQWIWWGLGGLCELASQLNFEDTLAVTEKAFVSNKSKELLWIVLRAMPDLNLDKMLCPDS